MKNDITTQRNMYEVLKDPERLRHEVRGVGGVLAYLWRTILKERQIWLPQFEQFVAQYIQKARRMQSSPKIANYFNRSNIFREMSRGTMTFKVFVKAMQLIGISRMRITVELEGRGKTTVHQASLQLSGEDGLRFEEMMEDEEANDPSRFPISDARALPKPPLETPPDPSAAAGGD